MGANTIPALGQLGAITSGKRVEQYHKITGGPQYGESTGVAGINCELSPAYLAEATSGETFTHGRGHSNFSFNRLG